MDAVDASAARPDTRAYVAVVIWESGAARGLGRRSRPDPAGHSGPERASGLCDARTSCMIARSSSCWSPPAMTRTLFSSSCEPQYNEQRRASSAPPQPMAAEADDPAGVQLFSARARKQAKTPRAKTPVVAQTAPQVRVSIGAGGGGGSDDGQLRVRPWRVYRSMATRMRWKSSERRRQTAGWAPQVGPSHCIPASVPQRGALGAHCHPLPDSVVHCHAAVYHPAHSVPTRHGLSTNPASRGANASTSLLYSVSRHGLHSTTQYPCWRRPVPPKACLTLLSSHMLRCTECRATHGGLADVRGAGVK